MTSFPAQARRVRDDGLVPNRRLHALRECTLHCAPYGFRATWHHLVVTARIPQRLEDDPDALVRAVQELEHTRAVLLPVAYAYAARRRREKAAGSRTAATPAPWNSWGWCRVAYCPDPEHHPTAPLGQVVARVLDGWAAGVDADRQCLACGTERHRPGRACPICGVHTGGPATVRHTPSAEERWKRIWRREGMPAAAGMPNHD
ncbi:hypothetical protein ACFFWC_23360 [Plantactinospora siamensis]|uniref:Uncharacterized protein n=1 Tax=Plantactinospora siamensis TaxID=555372 RepID=A0ABV6NUE0_9ACTN